MRMRSRKRFRSRATPRVIRRDYSRCRWVKLPAMMVKVSSRVSSGSDDGGGGNGGFSALTAFGPTGLLLGLNFKVRSSCCCSRGRISCSCCCCHEMLYYPSCCFFLFFFLFFFGLGFIVL